jgi:purine catabolism regulator
MLQCLKVDVSHVLGIYRQTIYAHIRSLKTLLGDDFMTFEHRVALEMLLWPAVMCACRKINASPPVPVGQFL